EFLDFDEAEAVLESTPPEWRLLVWTALRTGLRRAELFELRWRDLQLDPSRRPHVRVRRALEYRADGSIAVKSTKSNQPRTVPLTGRLAAALLHERDRAQPRDRELVFPGEGGGYLVYKQVHRMLRQTAERAGVQKPARLHVLRHTFASHCYMRGVPPQVVQKWLGHSSVVMTERYAHLRPDAGDGLIDVLEETLAHASPKSVHL
ncbi:MAG: site-specific integrase, partial [Myxococcales bacterium]|nr:site-specific integrase [Myxococcales bacterium]